MPTYLSPGVYVEEVPSSAAPIAGVGTSTAGFIGVFPDTITVPTPNPDYDPTQPTDLLTSPPTNPPSLPTSFTPIAAGTVRFCTNFSEFTKFFGGFSTDPGQSHLAHAVYGFFMNGGTSCYVVREKSAADIQSALKAFETIDEIAIVAAPGQVDAGIRADIVAHCKIATGDRFAIFDSPEAVEDANGFNIDLLKSSTAPGVLPQDSDYAAFYFPWIQVFDPATKIQNPTGDGRIFVVPIDQAVRIRTGERGEESLSHESRVGWGH